MCLLFEKLTSAVCSDEAVSAAHSGTDSLVAAPPPQILASRS
jgi:hypothetical protein